MRFNSALLLGAFVAGATSFVAANDLGRPGPAVVSGHVARSEPGVYSSGVEKRQDEAVPATSTSTATETSTSAPAGPSETAEPVSGTVHMADNSTAVNGTDPASNVTGAAAPSVGNTTNGTHDIGGALTLGVSAGALLVPLGMAFGALVLGSGALFA